jgi:hypothetical protein
MQSERVAAPVAPSETMRRVDHYLELAQTAQLSYEQAIGDRRRQLVETLTSNLRVSEKTVAVELRSPFCLLAERGGVCFGGEQRDKGRTPETCPNSQIPAVKLAEKLIEAAGEAPKGDTEIGP